MIIKLKLKLKLINKSKLKKHCWVVNSMRFYGDNGMVWTQLDRADSSWSRRRDMYGLCNWSDRWLLTFNIQECKIMHVGYYMPTWNYLTDQHNDNELQVIEEKRHLGAHIGPIFGPSELKRTMHKRDRQSDFSIIITGNDPEKLDKSVNRVCFHFIYLFSA